MQLLRHTPSTQRRFTLGVVVTVATVISLLAFSRVENHVRRLAVENTGKAAAVARPGVDAEIERVTTRPELVPGDLPEVLACEFTPPKSGIEIVSNSIPNARVVPTTTFS
jgi:hypothetical protein